ncbi:MAG: hypothetical protein JRH20_24450 [Deltaproteobacteria bacterium]|nr:hypothetical protein [Deltaproteobacteria bacterium]
MKVSGPTSPLRIICATLVLLSSHVALAQISVKGTSYTVLQDSEEVRISLSYTVEVTGARYFSIVEAPLHGTLYVWARGDDGSYGFQPLAVGEEVTTNYWAYSPEPAYVGKDSFKWQLRVDGEGTSTAATVSFTIVANTPPEVSDQGSIMLQDRERQVPLLVSDVDEDRQGVHIEIVSQPAHGTLRLQASTSMGVDKVYYTPDPSFVGEDTFSWHANDGLETSADATCRLLVRAPDQRDKTTVIVVVEERLKPELETDLQRLVGDLKREGYGSALLSFSGTKATELWTLLRAEYARDGQYLAGVILVGRMPLARSQTSATATAQTTDLYYWNLRREGRTEVNAPQIWLSRIHGSPAEQEVNTIRWALQANHDARTNVHRLPHTAFHYAVAQFDSESRQIVEAAGALEVWPEEQFLLTSDAWKQGGDLIKSLMHGSQLSSQYRTHGGRPVQVRYNCLTSCSQGGLGRTSNLVLISRGGGAVFTVGASTTTYVGAFDMLGAGGKKATFRARLADGDTWGAALRDSYPFSDYHRAIFYGDMSMPVLIAAANTPPRVDTLVADPEAGVAPLDVKFEATSSDDDGTIQRYEWYCHGFSTGTAAPLAEVGAKAACRYELPHHYLPEVQVIDDFRARGWSTQAIVVKPNPTTPLRINCGRVYGGQRTYIPGADLVDESGYVWLHEERYVADGSWGLENSSTGETSIAAATEIANTDDDQLFRTQRWIRGTGHATYRLPLGDGRFTVWLGLAELDGKVLEGQRLMDVTVEGESWLQGFDIVKTAGAAHTALFVSRAFDVTDGELTVEIRLADGSEKNAVINALVVFPGDHTATTPPDGGMQQPDAAVPPPPPPPPADAGSVADASSVADADHFLPDGGPATVDLGGAIAPDPESDAALAPGSDAGVPQSDGRTINRPPPPGGRPAASANANLLHGGCNVGEGNTPQPLALVLLLAAFFCTRRRN